VKTYYGRISDRKLDFTLERLTLDAHVTRYLLKELNRYPMLRRDLAEIEAKGRLE